MIGFPKNLNTKEDYEYVRKNFQKEEWEKEFQNLLDTVNEWFNMGVLADGDTGTTDDTHRVTEDKQEDTGTVTRTQWEYKENPDAKIFQLGYTVEEVKAILAGGENDA